MSVLYIVSCVFYIVSVWYIVSCVLCIESVLFCESVHLYLQVLMHAQITCAKVCLSLIRHTVYLYCKPLKDTETLHSSCKTVICVCVKASTVCKAGSEFRARNVEVSVSRSSHIQLSGALRLYSGV